MKWRPLSRRAFLGGAGTILPLPFLESLVPKRAQAATSPIKRAVFVFSPNGFVWDSIFPNKTGSDYTMPASLASLQPLRAKVALPMHLDNSVGKFPGDHANGTACFMTNLRPKQTTGTDIAAGGPSIDQFLVQNLGPQPTKFPYLNVGFAGQIGQGGGGSGDFGVSLEYINSVSWESKTKQLPFRQGPDKEFANLFSGSDPVASNTDQLKRANYKKSVLDVNLAEANTLKKKLSGDDGLKLDRFMSGVSELEKRVTGMPGSAASGMCGKRYAAPVRVPNTNYYGDWQKGWYQMIAMALECDLTRVVTFMLGAGFSNQSYGFLGIGDPSQPYSADVQHHIISHHGADNAKLTKLRKIDKFTFDTYGAFLGMLNLVDEGGGKTLLDNSVVYISSDVADGDHAHANYPVVLGGSAGGRLKTGQYWKFSDKKQSDLFTTILRAFDINKNHADSTGPITEMLV
ncbi:MAG: DUF1552 domain-containing protein [Deltaproteobacteria bacterium]|nr:DUF1552 domain-containing protein [Deltaproteobacteria bacterium]